MNQTSGRTKNRAKSAAGSGIAALSGRVPESLEAEAAVLGSMMLDPVCTGQVVQQIDAEAFYRPEHRIIFEAIVSLFEKNRDFDMVIIRDQLKKLGKLEQTGGPEYLVRLAESVPSAANVEYYTEIVKDKSVLRELISASHEVLMNAYEQTGDIREKLDRAEQKIFAVTEKKISGMPVPLQGILVEAFSNIQARREHGYKGIYTGLTTGFAELDTILGGLQKGDMIIIAGRPSMGKTSFAMNVAEHIGADNDIPIAIFSLEMNKQQLAERFLCGRAKVDLQRVRRGVISNEELAQIRDISSELFEKPIYIDDTPALTPLVIRAKSRRLKSQYGIQCILIDYLQLMSLGGYVESRQQEVSTMSRYLKSLAKELDIPVIVLSQLNRTPEHREGHRPRMSDLRESGSIEQDADVVMLLHRESYYRSEENRDIGETGSYSGFGDVPDNQAEVIIAKQRNGPTGTVKLYFDGRFTRFENPSRAQEPQVPF